MKQWFRPLIDIKDDLGITHFNTKKTYWINYESEKDYLVAIKPNNSEYNKCCKFHKKDEGIVFELLDYQVGN